ncbi:hypothetical protein ACJMK2_034896 [Sinanodonta woodiana]|uniref:Neutral ceramidase n=1 Tax=Sinanodonta woodiana TaxID=1069815 RepID=A0ABD3WWL9_SINWO
MAVSTGLVVFLKFIFLVQIGVWADPPHYQVGVGRADITGPAADVDLMGYANPSQTSRGIHLRQFARAFIIADLKLTNRIVFVNTDACMISQIIKLEVVKLLKEKYGDLYNERNLCISGTHTHSGPGGFHQYILFDITSLGFVKESYEALVYGIVESIRQAHESMRPANIFFNQGDLLDSNINRSPSAYLNNPEEERKQYLYDVDKTMTILKFVDANGKGFGMLSWFAVHCTSMNNTNHLISSDNKGYAELLFEMEMNTGALPGEGEFVAAFAQSNEGDVSPNTKGPRCLDTGKPCDFNTSTCNGRNELCVAFGPGRDMFESTQIIATNQFNMAMNLYSTAEQLLTGPVDFRHTYTDMSNVEVKLNATYTAKTCKPAMGYSFAAGTTDGPGAFNFTQGSTMGDVFWNIVRDFLHPPTDAQIKCHYPKPILLDTGEITRPYLWQPVIVDTQLLRIGQFIIIAVPAEFTTMAGRRMRDRVEGIIGLEKTFRDIAVSVIAGLSNDYSDYVTTYEEYQIQRYEGGSTIYGPNTLQAYLQVFGELAVSLARNESVPPGPDPPNLLDKQITLLPPVIFDGAPFGKSFGDPVIHPLPEYKPNSRVTVSFVGANPRNNLKAYWTYIL